MSGRWLAWTEWAQCESRCCRPWHPATWVAWPLLAADRAVIEWRFWRDPMPPAPAAARQPQPTAVAPPETWTSGGSPVPRRPHAPAGQTVLPDIDHYQPKENRT